MRLYSNQLNDHLNRNLAPIYLVGGEEPLLVDEAASAIRDKARASGYDERESYTIEKGFDWSKLLVSSQSMSLFGGRKIVELRLPTGRPGEAGAKTILELIDNLNEDTVFLFVANKLESDVLKTKWVKAIEKAGVLVTVYPLESNQFVSWLRNRLQQHGLKTSPDRIQQLAYHFEGNLLAAAQEIEKWAMMENGDEDGQWENSLSNQARFNVFGLIDTCIAGDVVHALRILESLRGDGVAPALILWGLNREIHGLVNMVSDLAQGSTQAQVFQKHRVWPKRQARVKKALSRWSQGLGKELLQQVAQADRVMKGRAAGDIWQSFEDICCRICGEKILLAEADQIM